MSPDLFGHNEESAPFKDIRSQRESVAEEKARLCLELNRLCKSPPPLAQFGIDQYRSGLARRAQNRMQGAGSQRQQPYRAAIRDQQHAGF